MVKNVMKRCGVAVGVLLALLAVGTCLAGAQEDQATVAEDFLRNRPEVTPAIAKAIREGIVVIGMTPEEAHAAGGGGPFHIRNDPKWPAKTDPFVILAAQTANPDASMIEMFFLNSRQYGTTEPIHFTAFFEHGRLVRIERGKPGA